MKKYLYNKAIEGYQHLHRNFNHWMRMYAFFNGALFAGYYTLKASKFHIPSFLEFMILLLGLVSGWLWHFSARGFYRWIISWIGVVKFYENQLGQNINLYRMFVHEEKEMKAEKGKDDQEENEKNSRYFYNPFSTQKLTKLFTFLVAVAWNVLLIYFLYRFYLEDKAFIKELHIFSFVKKYCYLIISVIIALTLISAAILKSWFGCREYLDNSHVHFKHNGIKVEEINKDKKEEKPLKRVYEFEVAELSCGLKKEGRTITVSEFRKTYNKKI